MRKKFSVMLVVMLTLLLMVVSTSVFNFYLVKATPGTIYIRADGTVDPPTAPIQRDGNVYTFTDNITYPAYYGIVVQTSNIIIDGNVYTLQGSGDIDTYGFNLTSISNATIKNTNIKDFHYDIWLNSSSFNTVSGNNITNTEYGVLLIESSNNTISGNYITNSTEGIELWWSSNSTLSGNYITNNIDCIDFGDSCSYNTISGNNITSSYTGIELIDSSNNNTICGNNITNTECGVLLIDSSNNKFYHNNFINNTEQVYDYSWDHPEVAPSVNTWDDGYPSGGNYWSDYEDRYPDAEEIDDSGIWNTPYEIDENNTDNYPLMNPYYEVVGQRLLVEEWRYPMFYHYEWGWFGSSPAIADLGPDVNNEGIEPDSDLEIITGSDEWAHYYWELGGDACGIWRCLDSRGNLEWAQNTKTDEARSSPAIIDIDGDDDLEIAAGTTSGWYVEVMHHIGGFAWTFPTQTKDWVGGPFVWPSSPAVADVNPSVSGLEVIIGNRPHGNVWAFDGNTTDGVDDGITITPADLPGFPEILGTEGTDWDVLWKFDTGSEVWSSPAVGDVDNDGTLEVVISSHSNVCVLDGPSGSLEHAFSTAGAVYASAALADLDGDEYLEIVVGSTDDNIYCFQWDGTTASTEWTYLTGGDVYSSAAIGDVDGDGSLEVVVGSNDGNVYSLNASGIVEWSYPTGGAVFSSPALANADGVSRYAKEWPMFRNNPNRTGLYGIAPPTHLDVYVGSDSGYLYLLDGDDGSLIDRFQVYTGPVGGIHTSPSVADIDGDYKLEIVFYDWGMGSIRGGNTFWCIEDCVGAVEYACTIDAYCCSEGREVSVSISMDGSPTGLFTPQTFINLTGSHNFTVPENDHSGHPFTGWSTGETSTTITVTSGGRYTAHYGIDIHDVAVTNVAPSTTVVCLNSSMFINVTVENQGNFTETFNVVVYHGDFKPEWKIFWSKGDINGDGYIDDIDLDLFDDAYGSMPGDPNWNPAADLDQDGDVDARDFAILADHYDLDIWTYLGVPPPIEMQLVTNLSPGSSTTITFTWNTTGVAKGEYTISAYALPVPGETETTDNTRVDGTVTVVSPGHDVAIKDVILSKTVVGQNYSLSIHITPKNCGNFTETFNVTAYYDTTPINTTEVALTRGNSTTFTFTWNTTGVAKGNYAIEAIADTVLGETDTTDNTLTDWAVVTFPGDIDGDYDVDRYDFGIFGRAYGSKPGDPNWNPNSDIDSDGDIDRYDFGIFGANYGKTDP